MIVRIIRYQNTTGKGEIFISHSNNLQKYQRRQFWRLKMRTECDFSAVKVVTGGTGKISKIQYAQMNINQNGRLKTISAGAIGLAAFRESVY